MRGKFGGVLVGVALAAGVIVACGSFGADDEPAGSSTSSSSSTTSSGSTSSSTSTSSGASDASSEGKEDGDSPDPIDADLDKNDAKVAPCQGLKQACGPLKPCCTNAQRLHCGTISNVCECAAETESCDGDDDCCAGMCVSSKCVTP